MVDEPRTSLKNKDSTETPPEGEWLWRGALVLFIIAGSTGAVFRFAVAYGWAGGLELENVRHAHSHLMYFGWGTPTLMVLIWRCLPTAVTTAREGIFRWIGGSTLVAAVLAYPLFLLYGYSPVQIGTARMPIAVVGAAINVFAWYGFVGLYVVSTWHMSRTGALRLWDVAVGALVLATLGAWGLSLLPVFGVESTLVKSALTHVFLDLFSEGWFVVGGLGVAFALLPSNAQGPTWWSVGLVVLGLPCTFILGLPRSQLPVEMVLTGRVGGTMVATGLLSMVVQLGRMVSTGRFRWLWGVPLGCLGLKGLGQLAGSLVSGLWLGTSHGLRILYLHLMLLGFLSLTVVAGAQTIWRRNRCRDVAVLYFTVTILLITLLPMTPWFPGGILGYEIAAWAALGPVLATGWLLLQRRFPVATDTVDFAPATGRTMDDRFPSVR